MKVVVVANRLDPETGYVGEHLEQCGARLYPVVREDLPPLDVVARGADLLLLLGSDWSVHDPTFADEVEHEQAVVRDAHERGLPIFGICYGAQLVAAALGATVARSPRAEIGWTSISSDETWCPSGPWFQYHRDRWQDLPNIGEIARTDIAPQAFTERRTLGVQFHPEATAATISRWVREFPSELIEIGADPDAIDAESLVYDAAARTRCGDLVQHFLDHIAARSLV